MDNIIEQILNLEAEMDVQSCSEGKQACVRPAQRSFSQPDCLALPSSLPPCLSWGALRPSNSYPPDLSLDKERGVTSDKESVSRAKEQRRKECHNMFERRRRFNINERIRDLGKLLPQRSEPYCEAARHSAGHVLKATVEYMQWLKQEVSRLSEAEARRRVLELENYHLRSRLQQLEAKVHALGTTESKPTPQASLQ